MNRARLDKLEKALADTKDVIHPRRPATPEEERQLFLDALPNQCSKAFGVDDHRADPAFLDTLSLPELHEIYKDSVNTNVEKSIAAGELDWFRVLPVAHKIRLCTKGYHEEEIERLKQAYEERKAAQTT